MSLLNDMQTIEKKTANTKVKITNIIKVLIFTCDVNRKMLLYCFETVNSI